VAGALLDAEAVHGGRTAFRHVEAIARSNGIERARVAEVLGQVGLDSVAGRRVGGFSLAPASSPPAPPATVRAGDLLASEWIKLQSVRSTYLTMLAAAVVAVGIAASTGAANAARWASLSPGQRAGFDPLTASLFGMILAQMAFGVLGVPAITSEHATGMIRTTFAAVPRRRAVLAAKAAITGGVTLTVGMATAFAAFLTCQALLSSAHAGVALSSPGPLRAVLGAGCYMLIAMLIGTGLGAIIRHTAGAITALFLLIMVLPQLVIVIPSPWNGWIERWLPEFHPVIAQHPQAGLLSPGITIAVGAGYAALTLVTAATLITRRDP